MAETGNTRGLGTFGNLGPFDYSWQAAGSTFDGIFAGAGYGASGPVAEGLEAGGKAFGGMFFVGGVIAGAASDGVDGAIKGTVSGAGGFFPKELSQALILMFRQFPDGVLYTGPWQ